MNEEEERRKKQDQKRESGQPGGGAGRRDEVKGNIYPATGPFPPGESTTMMPGQMGGGDYEESGESEIFDPAKPEKK